MIARRGTALILVLLMTLAVGALAIAAIFMTSSAGLLSRFYDKEREYRLAAESGLELARLRLTYDSTLAIPDTGMIQLTSGAKLPDATSRVSVNVYAAVTGDTSGAFLPHVTLIATAYDSYGTRHVRRMDLERESFSRYTMFADSFSTASGNVFGPGTVSGRVHSNQTWRSGTSAATAATYRDSVTAVTGFAGTATYRGDTSSGVPKIIYPRDSTYSWMTTRAAAANLSFAPAAFGSRLEFVAFDADGDATIEEGEGYARVFDLVTSVADTARLAVSIAQTDMYFIISTAKFWTDPVIQNQCGAFYFRAGQWRFFPVAIHRASWARDSIIGTGASNYPSVSNGTMNGMDDYSYTETSTILTQTTAACLPSGSPYLANTERFTDAAGAVTGGVSDVFPYRGRGGRDSTFTPRSRTCTFATDNSGSCVGGTLATLGNWRLFAGTAVTGIASTIRQAPELPYLWPISAPANPTSRGVMRATGGPLFVSGLVRGRLTLVVDGAVRVIAPVVSVNPPADPSHTACADQFGLIAVGDILVADNALSRARRIAQSLLGSNFIRSFGESQAFAMHGSFMSLTGTVGAAAYSSAAVGARSCPQDSTANSNIGCFRLQGGMVMRRFTPLYDNSVANSGMRWDGTADRCTTTNRRPPFFPLTNRYTKIRTLEVEPSQANSPTKIRSLLQRLKGKSL